MPLGGSLTFSFRAGLWLNGISLSFYKETLGLYRDDSVLLKGLVCLQVRVGFCPISGRD